MATIHLVKLGTVQYRYRYHPSTVQHIAYFSESLKLAVFVPVLYSPLAQASSQVLSWCCDNVALCLVFCFTRLKRFWTGFIVIVFGPIFALGAFPSRLAFRQNDPNYARGARKTRGIFGQNLVSFLPIASRLTSLNQFLAINRASRLAFAEIGSRSVFA